MLTSCRVKIFLKLKNTKENGQGWKHVVVLEEEDKDKGSPKV